MDMDKDGILDHSGHTKETLLQRIQLISKSCTNDLTIDCKDGEIKANKLLLSICSEYLANLLQDNITPIHTLRSLKIYTKKVLEATLNYLISGEIDLTKFASQDLVDLIVLSSSNAVNKEPLCQETQNYLLRRLKSTTTEEKYSTFLHAFLCDQNVLADKIISKFEFEFLEDKKTLAKLPFNSAKILFKGGATSIERLTAFHEWLKANPITNYNEYWISRKSEIVKTFDTKQFSKKDILGVVKESGFYTNDDLLNMMSRIIEGLEATCSSLKRKGEYMEEEDSKPISPKKKIVEVDLIEQSSPISVDKITEKEDENVPSSCGYDEKISLDSSEQQESVSQNATEAEEEQQSDVIKQDPIPPLKVVRNENTYRVKETQEESHNISAVKQHEEPNSNIIVNKLHQGPQRIYCMSSPSATSNQRSSFGTWKWSAILEWDEDDIMIHRVSITHISCPNEIKPDKWPTRFKMKLVTKLQLNKNMDRAKFLQSQYVIFKPEECASLKELKMKLSQGFSGIVHLNGESEVKVIILLFKDNKLFGCIPHDQEYFERLRLAIFEN